MKAKTRTTLASCSVCGFTYVPELLEDRKLHRFFHNRFLRPRAPKPDLRLRSFPPGDIRVDKGSPKWMHQLVYDRARALKAEEHYDFTQWQEDGVPWDWTPQCPKAPHAILLIEQGNIAVGVAAFQNGQFWINVSPGWHLLFVWVAPGWRRQGVISRRWPAWRDAYKDFTIETPISKSMASFLTKQKHPLDRLTTANPKISAWTDFVRRWE